MATRINHGRSDYCRFRSPVRPAWRAKFRRSPMGKWLKSFSIFSDAAGCKNDKQKRQLLLHTAGADVQDVFHKFTETGTDYKTAVDKLNQYFAPRKNTSYNRHIFRQEKQKEGETISQFVTMLDIAQAMEASESQSRQIAEGNQFTNVYSINRRTRGGKRGQRERQNPSKSKEKQCFRCGIKGHSGDDCRCSRNVTCFKCGKPGHFASMCRSKTPQGVQTNLDSQRGRHFDKGYVNRGNRVRYVDVQTLPPSLRD